MIVDCGFLIADFCQAQLVAPQADSPQLKLETGNFPPEADPPMAEKLGNNDSDSAPISNFEFRFHKS